MQNYRFCGIATNKTVIFSFCSFKHFSKLLVITVMRVFYLFRMVLNKKEEIRLDTNFVVIIKNTVNFVSEKKICSRRTKCIIRQNHEQISPF